MKNNKLRFICLVLCIVMMSNILASCNSKNVVNDDQTAETENVTYNEAGEYTVTITSETAKFSKLKAKDVSVKYTVIDETAADDTEENEDEEASAEEYTVPVTSVKVNGEKSLSVSFKDEKASDLMTDCYQIAIEKYGINVSVGVDLPELPVSANIDSVSAYDKEIRLTLTLESGSYAEGITAEDITLSGSFENHTVESLSAAGANLTLQLNGDIEKDSDAGYYLDGTVELPGYIFQGAADDTSIDIPVISEPVRFLPDTLKLDGKTVTFDINVYDSALLESLTEKNITFEENVTVTALEKRDGGATVTAELKDESDINGAASLLNGQLVSFGGVSVAADFGAASFYPVFDYVESDGTDLKFTLILYTSRGRFGDINAESVSLGGAFSDGRVLSLEKMGDTVAELMIAVPANGQTPESLDMEGTVILAAGAMSNRWGVPSIVTEYTRSYTQESMGKGDTSSTSEFLKLLPDKSYSNLGFANGFAESLAESSGSFLDSFKQIGEIAGGIGKAGTIILEILKITGVIESEQTSLDRITRILGGMQEDLALVLEKVDAIEKEQKLRRIDDFLLDLKQLALSAEDVNALYVDAGYSLDIEKPELAEPAADAPQEEWDAYGTAWEDYYRALVPKAAQLDREGRLSALLSAYQKVYAYTSTSGTDILSVYDEYMEYFYNFDSEAFIERVQFRNMIQVVVLESTTMIGVYYTYVEDTPRKGSYDSIMNRYNSMISYFEKNKVASCLDDKIYCYTFGKNLNRELYIGTGDGYKYGVLMGDYTFQYTFPKWGGSYMAVLDSNIYANVRYMIQEGDTAVVLDGKPVADLKAGKQVIAKTIEVTRGGKTYTYTFGGMALTSAKSAKGMNLTKKEIKAFAKKITDVRGSDTGVVYDALREAGFILPSSITLNSSSSILKGKDYVITAKGIAYKAKGKKSDKMSYITGKGKIKTNKYVVPVFNEYYRILPDFVFFFKIAD